MPTTIPQRIALLAGGPSAERDVSLQSGAAVGVALEEAGYAVTRFDPLDGSVDSFGLQQFDLVFLALHGTYGEDGTIQRQLDQLTVPYTGSGARASSLAFHKRDAKRRFLAARLPTPEFVPVSRELPYSTIERIVRSMGGPIAVKPEAQGSSLGVSIVESIDALPAAVEQAAQFDACLLLERAIPGEEWTVPVLDSVPLPPIRITTPHAFYDFTAKYQDDMTRYNVMLDVTDSAILRIQQLARQACEVLGCRGLCRVDFRVDPSGKPWILEVNTLPGMTTHSLVPKSAAASGWTMAHLCQEVISSAWKWARQPSHRRAS